MTTSIASTRAMGTTVEVTVHGGNLDAAGVVAEIDRLERCWSRFLPGSELNRMNDRAGWITVVSAPLLLLVEHLVAARRLTGGRFDPTMGAPMVALGYDRTYRELPADAPAPGRSATEPSFGGDIVVMRATSAVMLPAGSRVDPGGLGKGLAADLAAAAAFDAGADGVLVDLGGDIVARGCAPDGGPWRIEVPATAEHARLIVELNDGAVATSDTRARTWVRSGIEHRHVLEPVTGQPLEQDLRATVVAGAGWWAEAVATAAIVSTARNDHWVDGVDEQAGVSWIAVSRTERCDA